MRYIMAINAYSGGICIIIAAEEIAFRPTDTGCSQFSFSCAQY
jgi:hypothetical protein